MTFLLNHSIPIIFFLVMGLLIRNEAKSYMERKGLDRSQFLSLLRQRKDEIGSIILVKLVSTATITIVISLVSFRQLWMNDCFHIVFISSLLITPIESKLKSMF